MSEHPELGQSFVQFVRSREMPVRARYSRIYVVPMGTFSPARERLLAETREFVAVYFGLETLCLDHQRRIATDPRGRRDTTSQRRPTSRATARPDESQPASRECRTSGGVRGRRGFPPRRQRAVRGVARDGPVQRDAVTETSRRTAAGPARSHSEIAHAEAAHEPYAANQEGA